MSNVDQSLVISTSKIDYYQTPLHHEVAVVECRFRDFVGGYGGFVSAKQLMLLGNDIANVAGHVFRIQHVNQGVISDNRLAGAEATGHTLKLHAEPVGGETDGAQRPSVDFVITGNVFVGDDNDWSVAIGPQSARWNETVRNGILDGNHFIAGVDNQLQLHLAARDVTVRDNIFEVSAAQEQTAIHVVRRGIEPGPDSNRIYNNTCYSSATGGTAICVLVADSATNTLVHNNLLVAPNAGNTRVLDDAGSATAAAANLTLAPAVFSNPSPAAAQDFRLAAGSEPIDAGLDTGVATVDFNGTSRSTDGDGDGTAAPDIGAFEYPGP
jgi:hypothetical protein